MPLKLLFVSFLFLIAASCTPDIDVEEEVYLKLTKELNKEKVDLKKELNKLERFLVEKDVLMSKSSKSKRAYLKFVAKNDSFPILENFDDRLVVLNSPLDFQFLASAIKAVEKSEKEEFNTSELKALMDRIESGDLDKRSAPKTIAKALLKVDNEEFKKPLFRAMTLILIASSMSDQLESKDYEIVRFKNHSTRNGIRRKPLVCPPSGLPYYKTFHLSIDAKGELMIIDKPCDGLNDISVQLTKYYTKNRGLSKAESRSKIYDSNYEGRDYAFYSHLTLKDVQKHRAAVFEQLKKVKQTPSLEQDMIEFKQHQYMQHHYKVDWVKLSKNKQIQEINLHAEIYLMFSDSTLRSTKEKVYSELYRSIYTLRNKESRIQFDEDFETIHARKNIFLNDFNKLRLIEALFPVSIIEDPWLFNMSVVEAINLTE